MVEFDWFVGCTSQIKRKDKKNTYLLSKQSTGSDRADSGESIELAELPENSIVY